MLGLHRPPPAGCPLTKRGHDVLLELPDDKLSHRHLLLGHDGPVRALAVSPDARWIASASGNDVRLWPVPDLSRPPLHTLAHDELMAKLHALTNLQVVEDATAPTGYKLEIGPFPGWQDVPTW